MYVAIYASCTTDRKLGRLMKQKTNSVFDNIDVTTTKTLPGQTLNAATRISFNNKINTWSH